MVYVIIAYNMYDGEEIDQEIKGVYKSPVKAKNAQEKIEPTISKKTKIEPWVVI